MKEEKYNSECEFASGAVSYMYGEMAAGEQFAFESHLAGCQTCIDEFAAIAEARFSVYEWQKSEFAPLRTPAIRVPGTVRPSGAEVSPFARILAIFSFRPALTAAAIVVVLSFGVLTTWFVDQPDSVARVDDALEEPGPVRAPLPVVGAPALAARQSEPVGEQNDSIIQSPPLKERRVAKPANRRSGEQLRLPPRPENARMVQPRRRPAPSLTAQARNLPRLNGFSDDEDVSLRLAELFDDIDSIE